MKFAYISILLIIIFQNLSFADTQKEVLIINSYHYGLSWTDDSTTAEIDTIKNKYGDDVRIFVEYMDWKEHPTKASLEMFKNMIATKYTDRTFDLIITSDDAALSFVLENRDLLFSDIPIVFQGVSESSYVKLIEQPINMTGVLEIVDIRTTLEVAHMVNPKTDTFYIIHDQTESGKAMAEAAAREMTLMYPELDVAIITDRTIEEIVKFVEGLTNKDSILMTAYYTDTEGKNINFEDMIQKISQSTSAAVFSLYDFCIGTGALGGNMLSARLIGEQAGALSIQILEGQNPDNIPLVRENMHINAIDHEAAKKFNIDYSQLSNDIVILNKPISKFELYREFIAISAGVIAILTTFLTVLSIALRKTIKLKNELAEKNIEQKGLYDEIAASEEELKAQFDALNDLYDQLRESKENSEKISSEIRYAAYHDALTGYWNKTALEELVENDAFNKYALLLIDIDHFKRINDTMGHRFGDKYIQEVGKLLKSRLDENGKIFRVNGDEFVVYYQFKTDESLSCFSEELLNALNTVIAVEYSNFSNSISIGIAVYPEDGDTLEMLLIRADLAMYKAKETGRGRAIRYENTMVDHIIWRVEREEALKRALERHEFSLVYQPQVDCKTSEITGFEALIRWYNPDLGHIAPLEFIPIAEETQLIMPIGKWVLEEAASFLNQMQQRYGKEFQMAVNVSVTQLIQDDFVKMIMDILTERKINPEHFVIEITESVLMQAIDASIEKLNTLQSLGVKVSLDDFGTGYSSLSYLKTLPIDILKIDKSFVDSLGNSLEQTNLVEIIVRLGKQLNMKLVAEGVEYKEQLLALQAVNCDSMQGYYYSKPLNELACFKLLDEVYKK